MAEHPIVTDRAVHLGAARGALSHLCEKVRFAGPPLLSNFTRVTSPDSQQAVNKRKNTRRDGK